MPKELKWSPFDDAGDAYFWGPAIRAKCGKLFLTVRTANRGDYGLIQFANALGGRVWLETRFAGGTEQGRELAEELLDWWLDRKPLKPLKKGRKNARG